jgi:hypothetical protein
MKTNEEIIADAVVCNREALVLLRTDAADLRRFCVERELPFRRHNRVIDAIEDELSLFGNADNRGLVYI